MKKWYDSLTKAQKIFLYILASLVAFFSVAGGTLFFIGILPLLILIYLSLGNRKEI